MYSNRVGSCLVHVRVCVFPLLTIALHSPCILSFPVSPSPSLTYWLKADGRDGDYIPPRVLYFIKLELKKIGDCKYLMKSELGLRLALWACL